MTTHSLELLGQVRIASPCPMKWEEMERTGDDAVRHCGACRLSVHNLSDMSPERAEAFLREHVGSAGRVCAAFFRRADGTILTRDCPVGLRAARQRAHRVAARIAAMIGLALTGGLLFGSQRSEGAAARVRSLQPFARISEWISPTPPPPPPTRLIRGEVCVPAPRAQQPGPTGVNQQGGSNS